LHFKQFTMNRGVRGAEQPAMVDSAERVDFSVDFRHQAIRPGGFGSGKQLFQEGFSQVGHVAGYENIPVRIGVLESGEETAKGAAVFDGVGQDGKTEMGVFLNRTDERHAAGRGLDPGGDGFEHACAVEGQKGFVASHAAAGSANENEPRMSHEMILATSDGVVERNKKVYICFLVAFAMLAASPSRAADSTSATSAPVVRKTTVVRTDPRTGKLVRSVIVSSPAAPQSNKELNAMVEKSAKAHDVDPLLVQSVIKVESNYNVHAVSNKGAEGLMQLMPSTARMLGVSNSFDPQQNIEAGVKYLKHLKDLYNDDRLALAAYNAGPGSVDKYNAVPPYAETQKYVYQVGKRYDDARRAAEAAKPVEVPAAPAEVKTPDVKTEEVKPAAMEILIDENGRLHFKTTQ
jgi:hypothetical protein